jgi:hypothetical protein
MVSDTVSSLNHPSAGWHRIMETGDAALSGEERMACGIESNVRRIDP